MNKKWHMKKNKGHALVKVWDKESKSNLYVCREFYYIQMEKYARQALSEGIKNAEDLTVENELYRVLNLHYNRNNHIEVRLTFCIEAKWDTL
jgi:hypothetical protein